MLISFKKNEINLLLGLLDSDLTDIFESKDKLDIERKEIMLGIIEKFYNLGSSLDKDDYEWIEEMFRVYGDGV